MILIDNQGPKGQQVASEFRTLISRSGVKCEIERLQWGDFAFEDVRGNLIGVERKRLHDMLKCIEDARFSAAQRVGMRQMYREHWLLFEACWRPHDPKGILMEGNSGGAWWECKPYGRYVLYSKLRRYLFSVERSGTPIIYTRDPWHTAYDLCELFHYYQKKDHTSQVQIHKPAIASLSGKPSVTREWAESLDGVGSTHGDAAERLFKTPIDLAQSSTEEWMGIPGIGAKTATSIMRQIQTGRRR